MMLVVDASVAQRARVAVRYGRIGHMRPLGPEVTKSHPLDRFIGFWATASGLVSVQKLCNCGGGRCRSARHDGEIRLECFSFVLLIPLSRRLVLWPLCLSDSFT
jgi:hypothetical protein